MASLPSSCTALAANLHHRISPFSATKPSQHFLNARRSHRLKISCNGGGDSAEGARVDRRNMLLGLGGLYGTANLMSDPKAQANPIQPPDFKSCGAVHDMATGDALDINCCPPVSVDGYKDYKLPRVYKARVRRAAHKLSHKHAAKYAEAIRLQKELDVTDPSDPRGFTQQAMIHCAYCNGAYEEVGFPGVDISVHYSWVFFPFHRWYLYFYERILGSLIGDPHFALPFWNWDNPKGMQLPRIYNNPNSPLYDANRNPDHRPPAVASLALGSTATDPIQIISNNLSVMYNEMIGGVGSATDFMGKTYAAGSPVPAVGNGGTLERGSHTAIHAWVGDPKNKYHEDLGNFYSAGRDPAFYAHHANVDRMWTIWRKIKTNYSKDIHDADYLNSSFLFYDENKQLVRVTTADCLDHRRMGFVYERIDTPWIHYRPPKKVAMAEIEDISKGAKFADEVFPLTLKATVRVLVSVPSDGRDNQVLVLEDIEADPTKLVKFDVYVNDEDDEPENVDKAEYAGTFFQLPHKGAGHSKKSKGSLTLILKELYENIDIADDDTVVVTIVPRYSGEDVTIGGVKIIPAEA